STIDATSASKKTLYAAEQKRAEVARERRRWMRRQGMFDPAQLVFIDESWTNTSMVRLRGRCPRGERLIGYAPLGYWKTITFVAGLRVRTMVAPFVVEGAMNGPMFLGLREAMSRSHAQARRYRDHGQCSSPQGRRCQGSDRSGRRKGCSIFRRTRPTSILSSWPSAK